MSPEFPPTRSRPRRDSASLRNGDGRGSAWDASDGDYDRLRSERCVCGNEQVDLSHADQGGRNSSELDGTRAYGDATDGNGDRLNGDGQLRDGSAGNGGRAGGNGGGNGARGGQGQNQNGGARAPGER